MKELLERLIGKQVVVSMVDDSLGFTVFTVKEITDGAVLLEDGDGAVTIANLEYLSCVTEVVEKKKKKHENRFR